MTFLAERKHKRNGTRRNVTRNEERERVREKERQKETPDRKTGYEQSLKAAKQTMSSIFAINMMQSLFEQLFK